MTEGRLGPEERDRALERFAGEVFDIAVVGGGITGLGIALDAATRGLSVALVEAGDIAGATSSRSSKLIHGGLRYLEMRDFGLVREALTERRLLLTRIAPHLVRAVPFLFTLTRRVWERPYVGSGLLLYDSMGGARHVPRSRHLSKARALRAAPALRPDALTGAVLFHDCQEDDALFAAYVARTAAAHGAAIATRMRAEGPRSAGGRVEGLELVDEESGRAHTLRARHVISAAGVGTDRFLERMTGRPSSLLRPSKGIHLLVPREAIAARPGIFMRTEKSIFHAIPWGDRHWLLGDTDTAWDGGPDDPVANGADRDYVLDTLNGVLRTPVAASDVVGVFAGLRPLVAAGSGGDTTRLSRSHRLFQPLPGLTAIAGGKYTTYRVMARDAVDAALDDLGGGPPSRTQDVPLIGAAAPAVAAAGEEGAAALLRTRHGGGADEILQLAAEHPELARPIEGAERYLSAEAVHAVTHQAARDLDDVLSRRMRIALEVADQGRAAAADIAPFVARELGWSEAEAANRVASYVRLRDAEAAALETRRDADARARYADVLAGEPRSPERS
ncbi:MAG TPA: glycerol-3-phosphate dehydrogenase/oxidase [Gaiellales bacterium]|nr:glycerol-3-phosphate dehydrogenase/oxidase [Gaiellales bacterium]